PTGGHRSPEPAVVGFPTIVPHHEPMAGRNLDRRGEVALRRPGALPDVGVLLAFAVADDVPFDDRYDIARAGHDPLDEVRVRAIRLRRGARCAPRRNPVRQRSADLPLGVPWRMEDSDLADVGVAEVHADAV